MPAPAATATPTPAATATPIPASHQIAFDGSSSNSQSSRGKTLVISHAVGNYPNHILIVGTQGEDPIADVCTVSSITYNGEVLTKVNEAIAGTNTFMCVSLWYLLSPDLGTHDIIITWDGDINNGSAGGISIYNAAQQGPEAHTAQTLNSAAVITTNIIALTTGAWVIDAVGSGNSGGGFTPLGEDEVE